MRKRLAAVALLGLVALCASRNLFAPIAPIGRAAVIAAPAALTQFRPPFGFPWQQEEIQAPGKHGFVSPWKQAPEPFEQLPLQDHFQSFGSAVGQHIQSVKSVFGEWGQQVQSVSQHIQSVEPAGDWGQSHPIVGDWGEQVQVPWLQSLPWEVGLLAAGAALVAAFAFRTGLRTEPAGPEAAPVDPMGSYMYKAVSDFQVEHAFHPALQSFTKKRSAPVAIPKKEIIKPVVQTAAVPSAEEAAKAVWLTKNDTVKKLGAVAAHAEMTRQGSSPSIAMASVAGKAVPKTARYEAVAELQVEHGNHPAVRSIMSNFPSLQPPAPAASVSGKKPVTRAQVNMLAGSVPHGDTRPPAYRPTQPVQMAYRRP